MNPPGEQPGRGKAGKGREKTCQWGSQHQAVGDCEAYGRQPMHGDDRQQEIDDPGKQGQQSMDESAKRK